TEEPAAFIGHVDEPACPTPLRDLGIGQFAHGCQRLVACGCPVRQLHAFLIRNDTLPEAEMEKIARHDLVSREAARPQYRPANHKNALRSIEGREATTKRLLQKSPPQPGAATGSGSARR